MKMILLGPPGAGKGTQAEILSRLMDVPTISTGNILRAAMKAGTEVGLKAKSYVESGKLVPDDVIIGIIRERLAEPDCANGYILDGVPRTIPQAQTMEDMGVVIDCALSSFANGTSQPATETMSYVLRGMGFDTGIDERAAFEANRIFAPIRDKITGRKRRKLRILVSFLESLQGTDGILTNPWDPLGLSCLFSLVAGKRVQGPESPTCSPGPHSLPGSRNLFCKLLKQSFQTYLNYVSL